MGEVRSKNRVGNDIGYDNCVAVTGMKERTFSFRWIIEHFKKRLQNNAPNFQIQSPTFRIGEKNDSLEWQISVRWSMESHDEKYLSLFLYLTNVKKPTCAGFQIDVLNENYVEKFSASTEYVFTDPKIPFGWPKFVKLEEIINDKNGLIRDGNLKIQCKITMEHDVVHILSDTNSETDRKSFKRKHDLISDFATLYRSSAFADVTIKTKTLELKAHKGILACRSSVFSVMFQYDMSEAINSVVEILDFEHGVVKGMLEYIYCGEISQKFLEENSSELLKIADKYAIRGLKLDVEEAIVKTLSIENVAASIILADISNASELKVKAIKFINMNKVEFMKNAEFRKVLRDNPFILEELYLAE